jgi:Flp pilus assembly protein TadD
MQDYDQSIIYLEKAVEEMTDHARAHYNLGQLLDFKNETDKAAFHLQRATELEPKNLELLMALAEFYLKHEQFKEAKVVVLRVKELNPSDPTIDQALEFLDSKIQ